MDYLVSARCFTYNQAPYIEETMDGFTMQNTSFPFVCIIVDDASTDGEPEVIRRYMNNNFDLNDKSIVRSEDNDNYELSFAQHKTNKNCFFAVYYLKYNHYQIKKDKFGYISEFNDNVKYHALCEGDDCWCHPQKLQMQFDFLERHEDYGMVHTDYDIINQYRHHIKLKDDDGNWFPRIIIEGLAVGTLTVMFRKSLFDKIPKLYLTKNWPMDDKPLWYELAHEAKIKHIPIVTARYRVLENSASHSNDINKLIAFKNAGVEIRLFYANYYGVKLDSDGYDASYYEGIIRYACQLNDKNVAKDYYTQAKSKNLLNFKAKLYYFATMVPIIKPIIEYIVRLKNHRFLTVIAKYV